MKKTIIFFSFVAAALLMLASCEQTDLGRYCVVGFDNSSGSTGVKAINTEAPECIDRLCILQTPQTEESDLKNIQFCSKKCTSDSDCASPSDKDQCSEFICIKVGSEVSNLEGKGVCECRTHLSLSDICFTRFSIKDKEGDEACNGSVNE